MSTIYRKVENLRARRRRRIVEALADGARALHLLVARVFRNIQRLFLGRERDLPGDRRSGHRRRTRDPTTGPRATIRDLNRSHRPHSPAPVHGAGAFSAGAAGPLLLVLFLLLLAARSLGSLAVGFVEGDEAGIALGIAAMLTDTAGGLYRYTVQLGYYRLVEALAWLAGGGVATVPVIMKGLSAIAGALIPVAGFYAFRCELALQERWLLLLVLASSPVLWRSSQYGNTAVLALALSTIALVMLSNRPGRRGTVAALALLGMATLVRADTVLLAPLVLFLLHRSEGAWRPALGWSLAGAAAMALVYLVLFAVDPRIDSATVAVMDHMVGTTSPTMFWEFLLWAVSPLPLILAIWGLRDLSRTNLRLLGYLLLWLVPTLLFYFRATTTPRYFLNAVVPLAVAAAVGMRSLAHRLRTWVPASLAWATVVTAASLHLFLALGHFGPGVPGQVFRGATMGTADGTMPTGALLYSTYTDPNSFLRSLPDPQFEAGGRHGPDYPLMSEVVRRLADPDAPQRTVIVLLPTDWPPMFHYHALAAGARYLYRPDDDVWWYAEIWLQLGNTRAMTIGTAGRHYPTLQRFDVDLDDQVWVLSDDAFPDPGALERMPPGLALEPIAAFDANIRTFRVIGRGS